MQIHVDIIAVDKQLQKKKRGHFERHSAHQAKYRLYIGFIRLYIASSESFKFKLKVKRMYIQEQQPNQYHCYNQNMGFVKRIDQDMAKRRIGI